ncbi:MAG: hypothetical protein PHG61_08115 [Candidatus Marinimicrobia bacterium]|nr:hypothetical protein [Candidatus Neomarinimicrobiota bacterium]
MAKFWETSPVVDEPTQQRNWWEDSAIAESGIESPEKAGENAGQIYDMAIESEIPFLESEEIFAATSPQTDRSVAHSPTLAKRFGKQYYNSTVGNVVTAIGAQSEIGKLNVETKTAEYLRNEFRRKVESGEPVTADQVEFYAKPYEKWTVGWLFGSRKDPWLEKVWKDYEQGNLKIISPKSPTEAIEEFMPIRQAAQAAVEEQAEARMFVPEPETIGEKVIDAAAGIAGFTTQVVILKKASPSMPDAVVWENVNIANGGQFGHGAAMQLTLGGINRAIPGIGFLPAVERGTVASALFGTTTYLGGGDTVDILINMGIPFAFEGLGITKQKWAEYKNKKEMINAIKQKAPALSKEPDILIDKAISDLLTNVTTESVKAIRSPETLKKEFAPKQKAPEISEEIRQYMQRKRYDELLDRANAGDKKAARELNDYVQGLNKPTYEQLLEKAFAGDAAAIDRIQMGDYQGGPGAKPELQVPKPKKPAGAEYKPPTPIQRIRENAPIVANDIKPVTQKINPRDLSKARERGFITSVKEIYPELKVEGQYIPRATDPLAIKARNLIKDNIAKAEQIAMKGSDDKAVAIISELIKHYSAEGAKAKTPEQRAAMYDKAAQIANDSSAKLTELGRAVQAASILGRLTPEGQVRFAAKEIQRYNEKVAKQKLGLKKKIPELTAKQAEYIMKEMGEIQKIPEGKQKYIRFQKLQDYISDLVPTPLHKKIITTWKAGLLTGIKTSGLNIF